MDPQVPELTYSNTGPSDSVSRERAVGSRDTSPTQEIHLIQRMAAGDENALGELYDRWRHIVFALASRIVADVRDAEEVLEDTFWQAWRQASQYDASRGSVGTWLVTLARSRALDRARTQRRRPPSSESLDTAHEVASDVDTRAHVEHGEESRLVRAALA